MPPRIGKYCCFMKKKIAYAMHTNFFSMITICTVLIMYIWSQWYFFKNITLHWDLHFYKKIHTCFLGFVTRKRLRLNSFLAGEFKILEVERFNCTTLLLEALILLVPPIIETWVSAAMDLGRVLVFLRSIGEKQNFKIRYY